MKNDLLNNALYSGRDIPEVLKIYAEELRSTGKLEDVAHATKILEYCKMITNKRLLYRLRKNFNEIYSLIDKNFNAKFVIDGRRKSLISSEKKCQKLISEGKSLDLLRDIFAFRIILFGKNSFALINTCYAIANAITEHCFAKGLTLCEADPVTGTCSFKMEEHPEILIPKKSGINKKFQSGVKDYILSPKENGYQSIHLTFRATTGECFEVQIRTFDMHVHAESGDARHDVYKSKKYKQNLEFDPQKINIPGYGISPAGKVFDFIGLQEGLEILKREKTY